MNHANDAVAETLLPPPGWTLHSGGRQFGPMSDDELRRFFTSGVVTQADTLTNAALGLSESAAEAAVRLQVAAPKAAPTAAPLPPPVRHLAVQRVENTGLRAIVLALIMLALAGVYVWLPSSGWPGGSGNHWVVEANQLEDANDWQAALAHAQRWRGTEPSAAAWLYEGRALAQLARPDDAVRAFEHGLVLAPKDTILLTNLGALHFEQRHYTAAVQALEASVRIDSSKYASWYTLGQSYSALARHGEALSAFRTAAHHDPNDSGGWTEIGYSLYSLGRFNEAIEPLQKAIALEAGYARPRQILEAARDALAGRPSQVQIAAAAPTRAASAAAVPSESTAPAAPAAQPVAPSAPGAPDAAPASAANWDYWEPEARKLEDAQDWTGLRNFAERWTQEQPQRARAWSTLGTALRNLRQWEAAIKAHLRAAELAPNDADVLFRLGLSYSTNHDYPSAIPVYERVVHIDPGFDMAWNNLGVAYKGVGRLQDAISAYRQAVALQRGNIVAWNNLGLMYYQSNRFAESIAAYETALSVAPENEEAKVGLQRAKQR